MTNGEARLAATAPAWLTPVALVVAIGLVLVGGGLQRGADPPETWTALVGAGDRLAAGHVVATLDGQPLTARKAYLLAFHEAQDAGDVEHVLAVADRLEGAGETDLAAHVRRAAATLLDEIGARRPLPPAPG